MPRTYTVTIQNVVTKARFITQDTTISAYRNTDAEYIGWLNDAISAVVANVPQLFITQGTHTCTAGARQRCINSRAHSLVDVIGVQQADYATLSAFQPTWQTDTAGAAQNWMRPNNEPLDFFVYPKQVGGESLSIMYVESPTKLTVVADLTPLPETYEPALVDYLVGMVESKDDESVASGRAAASLASFVAKVKG
jgi:hypothetical protein